MRIDDNNVTFRFRFRGIASKAESLEVLRTFLHRNEWLPDGLNYDPDFLTYYTDSNGICEVTLRRVVDVSMEELADIFFKDLVKDKDVDCVMVIYNKNVDKLVHTHAGKYMNRQTVDLSNLKNFDEVMILYRK